MIVESYCTTISVLQYDSIRVQIHSTVPGSTVFDITTVQYCSTPSRRLLCTRSTSSRHVSLWVRFALNAFDVRGTLACIQPKCTLSI